MRMLSFFLWGILMPLQLFGQSDPLVDNSKRIDLFATFGVSLTTNQKAFDLGIEKQFIRNIIVQFRYSGIHEMIFIPDMKPQEYSKDAGVLIGKRFLIDDRDGQSENSVSLLFGIGRVESVERGEFISESGDHVIGADRYERIVHSTVGIPFECSYASRSSSVGFKAGLQGNINKYSSYLGVTLGFSFNLTK